MQKDDISLFQHVPHGCASYGASQRCPECFNISSRASVPVYSSKISYQLVIRRRSQHDWELEGTDYNKEHRFLRSARYPREKKAKTTTCHRANQRQKSTVRKGTKCHGLLRSAAWELSRVTFRFAVPVTTVTSIYHLVPVRCRFRRTRHSITIVVVPVPKSSARLYHYFTQSHKD